MAMEESLSAGDGLSSAAGSPVAWSALPVSCVPDGWRGGCIRLRDGPDDASSLPPLSSMPVEFALVVAVLVIIYLFYALVRGENL